MEAWGGPWAEATDGRLERDQVVRESHVLENWQDDAGWGEWQVGEVRSQSGQIEKEGNKQPAGIQIPTRKHTASDSIDSAVAFGTLPDDIPKPDSVNVLSVDGSPDSAFSSLAAGSKPELSSRNASKAAVEDANAVSLLQRQHTMPDASSNGETLSSGSFKASWEENDAAEIVCRGITRDTIESSTPDFGLIKQLFPISSSTTPVLFTEPDAIFSSISAHKVWSRLIREEALREFNVGESDGEYVRVNWVQSDIRKMTLGIVSGFIMDDRFNNNEIAGMSYRRGSSYSSNDLSSRSEFAGRNTVPESTGKNEKISSSPCEGDVSGRRTVGYSGRVPHFSWSTLSNAAAAVPDKFEELIHASLATASTDKVSVTHSSEITGTSAKQDLRKEIETPVSKYTLGVWEEEEEDDDDDDEEWGEMVGSGYVNEKKSFTRQDSTVSSPTDLWRQHADNSIVKEFVNSLPDISYIFR